jgi:putative DNA primase/helicase
MATVTLSPCPISALPQELQPFPQWVAWKYVPRKGRPKPAKVPINPRTSQNASPTDPTTWATVEKALDRCVRDNLAGIGFVFTAEDPFTGIDLDNCRNPVSEEIAPWAVRIVEALQTYTEISPSGTGLRLILKGKLPPRGRKKGNIEMYDDKRFETITGQHLEGTPLTIEPRQAELDAFHAEVWPETERPPTDRPQADPAAQMDDIALLSKALRAKNGKKFNRSSMGTPLATHPNPRQTKPSVISWPSGPKTKSR